MDEETTLVEYRTEQDGDKFVAFDSTGELVGAYDSEEQARTDVERAKLETRCTSTRRFCFTLHSLR